MNHNPDNILQFSRPKAKATPAPKTTRKQKAGPYRCTKPFQHVFRFKVTLLDVTPVVWRRIEVPDCDTFWDLHVAITDVFGWLDYHLHEFEIVNAKTGKTERIGSTDDEAFDELEGKAPVKLDRQQNLADRFNEQNRQAAYSYDFGDGWEHMIELEEVLPREADVGYPRCTAGEMAAPPDDCGGPGGYQRLLNAIRNVRHPEHTDQVNWLKMMKGAGFKPDFFDPAAVHFDDPDKRWKIAFENGKMTPDMRSWDFFKRQRR